MNSRQQAIVIAVVVAGMVGLAGLIGYKVATEPLPAVHIEK